jgi:hypothetical protein
MILDDGGNQSARFCKVDVHRFHVLPSQNQMSKINRPKKQKTRWGFLRQRADECFVLRNSMHTSSGAAYGRDDGGCDAPESSQ